jgi:hypothetical protein
MPLALPTLSLSLPSVSEETGLILNDQHWRMAYLRGQGYRLAARRAFLLDAVQREASNLATPEYKP